MHIRFMLQIFMSSFVILVAAETNGHAMTDTVYTEKMPESIEKNPQNLGSDFVIWNPDAAPVGRFLDRSSGVEVKLNFVPYPAYVGKKGRVPRAMVIKSVYQGKQRKWGLADTGLDFESYSIALGGPDQDGRLIIYIQRRSTGMSCCNYIDLLVLNSDEPGERFTLPGYTGDMWSKVPQDETGDGTIDFVIPDIRFQGLFADNAGSLLPPRLFSLRADKMVDVSREARSRFYYRDLMSDRGDGDCNPYENSNSGNCAHFAAVAALAGQWPQARHEVDRSRRTPFPENCGDFGDAACSRYLAAVQSALRRFGYLPPKGEDGRNWVGGWLDFFGIERDSAIPLDVQQFIYDWQGCDYYREPPMDMKPGEPIPESQVDMIEEYCRDIDDQEEDRLTEEIGFDLQKKYRDDPYLSKLLKFPFDFPAEDSWGNEAE